jgi:predicted transcriptional regulator
MSTLTLRIDEELEADLDRLAHVTHRSKSDVARAMLRKQIAISKLRELRQDFMLYAEKAGYLTDEDIFRDIS